MSLFLKNERFRTYRERSNSSLEVAVMTGT